MIDPLIRAVLYEGYSLYPYRPSALKNQRRFAFGVVYPRAWADRALEVASLRAEVIARGPGPITATLHFLRLTAGGATEHAVAAAPHVLGGAATEAHAVGDLALELAIASMPVGGLWRYAIEVRNASSLAAEADREAAMDRSPASLQIVIRIAGGELISAIDPPADAAEAVAGCRSTGLYPILTAHDAMLCSPMILPDFPELAPQSPGDFFDGTEIDELLTLRVLTMTEVEKAEACAADPRIAALIARTETLGLARTAQLHGTVRTAWPREGTRVRLRPAGRADAFDLLLAGKLATIASVSLDLDGRVHCAVTIDDDPGADLGATGMPGHRFFFRVDELEVLG